MVSIIVPVYNGLTHIKTLLTNNPTAGAAAEWIVVDNGSGKPTADFLATVKGFRVIRSDVNLYFAGGNNLGASHSTADHLCLLNSDVRIRDPRWLEKLLTIHREGITAYGVTPNPTRADGFCLLVDRRPYDLDATYAWNWSVTRLQAKLLSEGYSVQAIRHFNEIAHYGGGSGPIPKGLPGMNTPVSKVIDWFKGLPPVRVIERTPDISRRQIAENRSLKTEN